MNVKAVTVVILVVVVTSLVMIKLANQQTGDAVNGEKPEVKEAQTKKPLIFKDVTPSEANDLILKNKENPAFVVIDVRTASEFAAGRLEKAVNLDYNSAGFSSELEKLDKSKVYLIYCRSGGRSQKTFELMKGLGFGEVYNLLGGINSWAAQGLPTVK